MWSGNGHHYQLSRSLVNQIDHYLSWTQARVRAESLSFQGVSGHLVTITSQGENDFLVDRLLPAERTPAPLIGGFQPAGSAEPDGGWQWVTGEPFAYTNWAPAAPNNAPPDEDFLIFFDHGPIGSWNDVPDTVSIYIIEYDTSAPAGLMGTIVLSGDSSIAHFLIDDGDGIPVNPGNVTFFRNVLGANEGSRVALSRNHYSLFEGIAGEMLSEIGQSYSAGGAVVSFIPIGGISVAALTAVDLLVILLPEVDFSPAETTAMSDFLSRGGTLFFLGEHAAFSSWNDRISATLGVLGSQMAIANTLLAGEGVTTNLAGHSLLAGVTAIRYMSASTVAGGTTLVSSEAGERLIAMENVEP
jgi:hypothetical protein